MDIVEVAVSELEEYRYEKDGELVTWLWENVQAFNMMGLIEKLEETVTIMYRVEECT
jgi:hypothetical protein